MSCEFVFTLLMQEEETLCEQVHSYSCYVM